MIGKSLSFCIRDILDGRVKEEDVFRIEASTAAVTEADWERVISLYCDIYWKQDPARARQIVARMRDGGNITQPRLLGQEAANIHDGWWA